MARGLLAHFALEKERDLDLNDDIYGSNLRTSVLSTTAILIIWLWLVSVQLAQDWGQRGQEREFSFG